MYKRYLTMGRSQVLRNQRLGRPGQRGYGRGRGRGERIESSSRQRRVGDANQDWKQGDGRIPLNTNSVVDNVTISQTTTAQDDVDEQIKALEAHGNYYGISSSINVKSENDEMGPINSFLGTVTSIDAERIDQGLSTLSISQILNLPLYLTESLEGQSRHLVGATLRRSYEYCEPDAADADVVTSEKVGGPTMVMEQHANENVSSDSTMTLKEEDDEEDMEAWLDSVIS